MKNLLFGLLFFVNTGVIAQDVSFSKPGNLFYKELPNPAKANKDEWGSIKNVVSVSFASDNIRYPKHQVPYESLRQRWDATAWRGEKVHTQLLIWTSKNIPSASFQIGKLVNKNGKEIPAINITPGFVRYVMSDQFDGGCAHKTGDSSLVEDPIDIISKIQMEENTVQPVWLTIQVPANTPVGKYEGSITINAIKKYQLKYTINVLSHLLPPPDKWTYDLDLWQYPDPIVKIHNVELWSKAHFALMKSYYTILAKAGQKTITANIIEQPWGLDHVYFRDPSLVKWIKKKDGTWAFDFSLFDKYISFVMSCGINQRINCYSMITWDLSFIYFDEQTGKYATIKVDPATPDYSKFWLPMLKQFTVHLKNKNWFNITAIAMDERPIESMQAVIALLKSIDPNWKIALATDKFHPEIQKDIFDLSIASYLKIEDSVLQERKAASKPTTFYTACNENHPGPYTFSPPAENAWLAWHAAYKGYTGYLFWAFNTWPANPLQDARYGHYPSGTCFEFYPGPRTSIRFEKLIEGIQDFEKISILKKSFIKERRLDNLNELNKILAEFEIPNLDSVSAADMVEMGKKFLNKF